MQNILPACKWISMKNSCLRLFGLHQQTSVQDPFHLCDIQIFIFCHIILDLASCKNILARWVVLFLPSCETTE